MQDIQQLSIVGVHVDAARAGFGGTRQEELSPVFRYKYMDAHHLSAAVRRSAGLPAGAARIWRGLQGRY